MGLINLLMGQLMTYFIVGVIVAGVMKLFQVSSELSEIKDLLGEIKRHTAELAHGRPEPGLASPASLMRAVNAEGAVNPPAHDAFPVYEDDLVDPPRTKPVS